jgi:hypothetical protein
MLDQKHQNRKSDRCVAGSIRHSAKYSKGAMYMHLTEDRMRSVIAQGLAGMLFILLFMFTTDYVEYGIKGDFSALAKDPGLKGIWILTFELCLNVLMQISVQTFNGRSFRWVAFVFCTIYFLLFVMHQVMHLVAGETFDMHTVLDITHHIVGLWTAITAYKWAKLKA